MGFKTVRAEFEAKLRPVGGSGVNGKVERKTYGSGEKALSVRVRGLDAGVAGPLHLYVNKSLIAAIESEGKSAKLILSTDQGDVVPVFTSGDVVELRLEDITLSNGTFVVD